MLNKQFAIIAAVSAIATIVSTGSAQATTALNLGVKVDAGTVREAGVTNQGSFKYANDANYQVFDFNTGKVPGNDAIKYSFSQGTYSITAYSGQTGIYADKWAPSGSQAEVNASKYLAVFQGNDTIIELTNKKFFNYFGFNAGALSGGNTLAFYKQGNLVQKFTYDMLNVLAPVAANQHGGQKNGFFEFTARNESEQFDKIVISQTTGGGFESDNHTFRTTVPEPSVAFGMLAVGGLAFLRKRNKAKTV